MGAHDSPDMNALSWLGTQITGKFSCPCYNYYRIVGNFDVFDAFQPYRQNLTRQFLSLYSVWYKRQ